MFHWDHGLFLNRPRLALDVRRGQPHGFVSHAHADHIGPHQLALCTRETGLLYRERLGRERAVLELCYRQPVAWGDVQLTAFPAGHCLGSAMLLVEGLESGGRAKSLLYTGDFKLGPSATAETAESPQADVLIMESTFGRPAYRMPPRSDVVAQLLELVAQTLADGATPVIHAYPLGKSQEATRLLTQANIPVLQHPAIFKLSQIYQACGVKLGNVSEYDAKALPGKAVVTLPKQAKHFRLAGIDRPVSIALTGWAVESSAKYRWQVDHALPLSDHADFDELLQLPSIVGAKEVYCTHGPREFVDSLRSRGVDARPVTGSYQLRLF